MRRSLDCSSRVIHVWAWLLGVLGVGEVPEPPVDPQRKRPPAPFYRDKGTEPGAPPPGPGPWPPSAPASGGDAGGGAGSYTMGETCRYEATYVKDGTGFWRLESIDLLWCKSFLAMT